MIIECPACNTRYDIKSKLPSEGRTVRCAKCGTVWRAMPDSIDEHAGAAPSEASAGEPQPSIAEAREQETAFHAETHQDAAAEPATAPEWSASAAGEEAAYAEEPAVEDPAPSDDHAVEPAAEQQPQLTREAGSSFFPGQRRDADQQQDLSRDGDNGKVRWFSSFRRKTKARAEPSDDEAVSSWGAATIPFPRAGLDADRGQARFAGGEANTLEEARQAVRGVFSSLGDVRPSAQSPVLSSPVTTEMGEDEAPSGSSEELDASNFSAGRTAGNGWLRGGRPVESGSAGYADWAHSPDQSLRGADQSDGNHVDSGEDDGWNTLDRDAHQNSAEGTSRAWIDSRKSPAADEDGDTEASLRDAMRAHFPSSGSDGLAEELENHLRSNTPAAENDGTWAERAAALWKRPALPIHEMAEKVPAVEEDLNDAKDDDRSFDPRLYREIEETQEHAGEARRREGRGGLALAAAWGLFLCAASGLIVGFFAFRDIAADALPGLAPLYRALGRPVTVQPLIFESVQYQWSTSENKPALLISGSVYNRAQRKVRVPQFFITIKDEDPALDREYSVNLQVNASKIRPDQRANFEIELLSPNPTVTSVELELRNVR